MNSVFCFVLSQKQMRNVFNSLLIAMAIFDTLFLLFSILDTFWNVFDLVTEMHIYLFPKILYPFRSIVFCSSILMTVSISVERYIAVSRPISLHLEMRNDSAAQVRRFLKYLIPVFGLSLIVNIPTFFEIEAIYDNRTKTLEIDPNDSFYFLGIALFIVTLIIPFVTVLYFNVRTYRIIYIRRKNLNTANENMQQTNNGTNEHPFVLRAHVTLQEEQTSEEKLFIQFQMLTAAIRRLQQISNIRPIFKLCQISPLSIVSAESHKS